MKKNINQLNVSDLIFEAVSENFDTASSLLLILKQFYFVIGRMG